jgi:catechol 2,3-dioxygenase-like lactoylglutathione lyase family enzyme
MDHPHLTTPGHIGLAVRDLDRSIPSYLTAFALRLMARNQTRGVRFAFLGDGSEVTLTLWESGDAVGLHHLAFRAPSADALRDAAARLAGLGARMGYDGIVPPAPVPGAPSCGFF